MSVKISISDDRTRITSAALCATSVSSFICTPIVSCASANVSLVPSPQYVVDCFLSSVSSLIKCILSAGVHLRTHAGDVKLIGNGRDWAFVITTHNGNFNSASLELWNDLNRVRPQTVLKTKHSREFAVDCNSERGVALGIMKLSLYVTCQLMDLRKITTRYILVRLYVHFARDQLAAWPGLLFCAPMLQEQASA
jgi:hypothetical protein